jgi:hypothetical protein
MELTIKSMLGKLSVPLTSARGSLPKGLELLSITTEAAELSTFSEQADGG